MTGCPGAPEGGSEEGHPVSQWMLSISVAFTYTTSQPLATVLAGLFVILSEVNWIRFRGPIVYDPNDLAASVLGLFLIYFLLARFGLFYEREAELKSDDE